LAGKTSQNLFFKSGIDVFGYDFQGTFLDRLFSRSQIAGYVVVVGDALLHVTEFVPCRLAEAISFCCFFGHALLLGTPVSWLTGNSAIEQVSLWFHEREL
jgi:hypothetical protein